MKTTRSALHPCPRQAGFTLVEVMVSSALSLLVVGGALAFLIIGVRSSALATSGSINDLAQWGIASRLWVDARIANGISIYQDYTAANVERWLRRVVNDGGNFMVFSLSTPVGNQTRYTKLTGYYFIPTASGVPATGTVYRFDYDVSSADQTAFTPLEDILRNNRTAIMASATVVADDVTTFMTTTTAGGTTLANVFLSRSAGAAASLACSVSAGTASTRTRQQKVIEATFYIRS
jgi:prepilin-type N-terminal cleavage/methylation domain-containing protein